MTAPEPPHARAWALPIMTQDTPASRSPAMPMEAVSAPGSPVTLRTASAAAETERPQRSEPSRISTCPSFRSIQQGEEDRPDTTRASNPACRNFGPRFPPPLEVDMPPVRTFFVTSAIRELPGKEVPVRLPAANTRRFSADRGSVPGVTPRRSSNTPNPRPPIFP